MLPTGTLSFPKRFMEEHGRNNCEDFSRDAHQTSRDHRIPAGHARKSRSAAATARCDCRKILSGLLPFTENEMEFLNQVLDKGKITPELLTDDADMQDRIRRHPLLEWKAMNVRAYK